MAGYAGGLFIPFRDATNGTETYGAGRYLVDAAKSADLGGDPATGTLIVDFNFAVQPSCAFDPRWACPLAPPENRLDIPIRAGERLGPLKPRRTAPNVPMDRSGRTDASDGPPDAGRPAQDDRVRFLAAPRRRRTSTSACSGRATSASCVASPRTSPAAACSSSTPGIVLIAPAEELTDRRRPRVASEANTPRVRPGRASTTTLPERDRYLVAMSAAVQLSGLAERIGMAQSTQVVQTKMLDYFFSLRKLHTIAFQPIVTLDDRRAVRVRVPVPPARCRCCRSRSRRSSRRRSTPTVASSSTSTSSRTALEQDRPARGGRASRRQAARAATRST